MTDRAAVLLVGGRGRRMGSPKASLVFGGKTLLERAVAILAPAVEHLIVVHAPGQSLPDLPRSVQLAADEREDHGPLEGLRVGLFLAAQRTDRVFVSAVDTPFLVPAFVSRLFDLLGNHDAAIPMHAGHRHPLSGCYLTAVAELADELLAVGERRPRALLDRIDTRYVTAADFKEEDPEMRSLRNLNDPDDLRAALSELSGTE
ncbi:MAG: molybdenum cofactor guanylyltransferase [Planctomycetota bacterium]